MRCAVGADYAFSLPSPPIFPDFSRSRLWGRVYIGNLMLAQIKALGCRSTYVISLMH